MLGQFDFNVIERSIGYLFREGMTFTLTLTALAVTGGDSESMFSPLIAAIVVHGAVFARYYLRSLWLAHTLLRAERRRDERAR